MTTVAQAPVANFSASATTGCGPLAVSFTDLSTGSPIFWSWDFGNGQTSHSENPSTSYSTPGSYTVKLIVVNKDGQDSITKFNLITVPPYPTAKFTANLTIACQPAGVQFQDLSTPGQGSITAWVWNFGDGSTGNQSNPFHVYAQPGYYDVSLAVTNSSGCTSNFGVGRFLRVVSGVQADFAYAQTSSSCSAPFQIGFTNQTAGPGTLNYNWTLGNGSTSLQTDPSTTYPSSNSYTVTLIAQSSLGCSDTVQKNISLSAANAVITSPDSICINNPIVFRNGSTPAPLSSSWSFGDGNGSAIPNPSNTYTTPGPYQVKLVNTYSTCSDSVTKTVTAVTSPTANFTATTTTACSAPFTASFQDASTPAIGLVKRIWNFGDGTPLDSTAGPTITHKYNTPGNYSVTLTVFNSGGCSSTLTKSQFIHVVVPSVTLQPSQIGGCVNTTPFQPTAVVNSADGVASYSWSAPGATPSTSTSPTPSFNYSTTGSKNITLTIQTNDGCTVTTPFPNAFLVGTPTAAAFTSNATIVCRSSPAIFHSTSAPADRWDWNFGDGVIVETDTPGIYHTYKNQGIYNVFLTVIHSGCPSSTTSPVVVQVNPPVAGFSFMTQCNANKYIVNFTDTSQVDPAKAINYTWDFGDGNISGPLTVAAGSAPPPITHTYAALGHYTVNLTVADVDGTCSDLATRTVTLDSLTASISAPDSVCRGSNFTMNSSEPIADTSLISDYSWTVGGASAVSTGKTPSYSAKPTANGPLTLSLTIKDLNGCSFTSQPLSTQVIGPTAKFATTGPGGCVNNLITFTDQSVPDVYAIQDWSFIFGDGVDTDFTHAPFFHRYADTGYFNITLTIQDKHNCLANFTLDSAVHITSLHAGFYTPDTLYCPNVPLPFTDSSRGSNISWSWDLGNGFTSTLENPAPSYPTNSQIYTIKLKISDPAGCADSVTHTNYIHIQSPIAAFTIQDSTSICLPLQTVFIPNAQYYDSLYWDFGDGSTSTLAKTVHFYNNFGTYTAKLILKGDGGCMDSASRQIYVLNPATTASITYSPFPLEQCDSFLANFQLTVPAYTHFEFFFGDATADSSGSTTLTHLYKGPNNYGQQLVLVDATGCIVNVDGQHTILVLGAAPFFSISKHKFCDSSSVTFTDFTFTDDLITGETWNFGDGSPTTTQPNPSHYYSSPNIYYPTLNVTTQHGCSESYTDTVIAYQTPHPSFTVSQQPCARAPILFTGAITQPDADTIIWAWDFGDGQTSGKQDPSVVYQQPGIYTVSLKTSISFGCSDTTSQQIDLHTLPSIKGPAEITIAEGFPTTLPFTYSAGIVGYAWTPATNLNCTDCPNPMADPIFSTEYKVTVTDTNNCSVTDSVLVKTVCNGKNYFIPNTFSPNGDGVNDVFYPRGNNLYNVQSMRIFNRWGQMVFEKRDFPANSAAAGWDGTFNGRPAPVDVYVYTIEVVCDNAQVIALNGNITLVR